MVYSKNMVKYSYGWYWRTPQNWKDFFLNISFDYHVRFFCFWWLQITFEIARRIKCWKRLENVNNFFLLFQFQWRWSTMVWSMCRLLKVYFIEGNHQQGEMYIYLYILGIIYNSICFAKNFYYLWLIWLTYDAIRKIGCST
jgi:hypothetical protein